METNDIGGFIMELGFWVAFKVALGFSLGYGISKVILSFVRVTIVHLIDLTDAKSKDKERTANLITKNQSSKSDQITSMKSKCKIGFY